MTMLVEQIWTNNSYRNFHYLVACPETGEALAIDLLRRHVADFRNVLPPECDAEAGDTAPDADRQRAPVRRHRAGDERERERHDRGGAEALEGACADDHPRFGAERREHARGREDGDAGEEDGAAAEPVPERCRGEDERREGEGEGVQEPLQLLDPGAEVGGHDREGVGDDEVVERRHEHRQGRREEDEPDGGPAW